MEGDSFMSLHSVLIATGMAAIVALSLIAAITANLLGIAPKKWRLWMLGDRSSRKESRPGDVVI
jgi:putative exporter of polyketide antibiotics